MTIENKSIPSDTYVIGISADPLVREGFLLAGANDFVEKNDLLGSRLIDLLKNKKVNNIVLVDDSSFVRKPMGIILANKLGIAKEKIIIADNPITAAKLIKENKIKPDVIITDNEMHNLDGIPFVKMIRSGETERMEQ